MARPKSKDRQWMPPHTTVKKGRYVYVPYLGFVDGRREYGQEITLGRVDTTSRSAVWRRYEEITGSAVRLTVRRLLDDFTQSQQYRKLSPRTRRDYEYYQSIIAGKELTDDRLFGDVPADKVTPGMIRGYLDKRADEGAPIAGNKEIGLLSAAYSWAYERDTVKVNPCIGVRRNPRNKRQHRPTSSEYETALKLASPEWAVLFMELTYLCRLRGNEALKTTRAAIEDRGLRIRRGKGSKGGLVLWTPRLRAVVDRCLSLPLDVTPIDRSTLPLLHDRRGQPKTIAARDSALRRLNMKMKAAGLAPFWFHDLKRAGVSDFEGDKLKASGHRDPKMLEVYDVSDDEVPATR